MTKEELKNKIHDLEIEVNFILCFEGVTEEAIDMWGELIKLEEELKNF